MLFFILLFHLHPHEYYRTNILTIESTTNIIFELKAEIALFDYKRSFFINFLIKIAMFLYTFFNRTNILFLFKIG